MDWKQGFINVVIIISILVDAVSSAPVNNDHQGFWIEDDAFWKDGHPFQIVGGDVHYFRIVPEYWRDRLLRAKALGLNTIQTYVPWNLHEPRQLSWEFTGVADLEAYIRLAQDLGLLVMLRVGPYICGEWDLGGFPAWLLSIRPAIKLRSSDVTYLSLVERWWGVLLPKVQPLLYENGGPIIMVQIENEFGSFGNDNNYLHHLVQFARQHLGNKTILYTTDGGTNVTLTNGSISVDGVFAAVDFSTGEDAWSIFKLQKHFNMLGKSPPLSAEFYTGWLTHWGEEFAKTRANDTAEALERILCYNGSAVLYMAHGGTNFGFYNGANCGDNESDYKADLTSYDYDAPIKECGDVDNPKYKELRQVIHRCTGAPLLSFPPKIEKVRYGTINVKKISSFFEAFHALSNHTNLVTSQEPLSMESVGQMFGFSLYISEYEEKNIASILSIAKVNDRAQVFVACTSDGAKNYHYVGVIERWFMKTLTLPNLNCSSNISLYILVENMGRINYGRYIFDEKGILSDVNVDGATLYGWKIYALSFEKVLELTKPDLAKQVPNVVSNKLAWHNDSNLHKKFARHNDTNEHLNRFAFSHSDNSEEPAFYKGTFNIDPSNTRKDTFISFHGWTKGVAFVNGFNVGRFWPAYGPQCTLYIPAPILRHGENVIVIFELHRPKINLAIELVEDPDFTCGLGPQTAVRKLKGQHQDL